MTKFIGIYNDEIVKKRRRSFNRVQLMELSRCAMAQIIPACLNDDHFTDDGSYWDPERWFMASFEKVRIYMEICEIFASQFHHLHALLYILCDLIFMVLTHPHFFFRDFRSLPLTF